MLEDFDLLTLAQVAELLRVSKAHVSKVVAGKVEGCSAMPAVRLGRRKLVRRKSLEAWVAANDRIAGNDNLGPAATEIRKPAQMEDSAVTAKPVRKSA